MKKQGKIALVVGIASLLTMLIANAAGVLSSWDSISSYTPGYVLYQLLRSIVAWSWMLYALYFGMRVLNFTNRVIDYTNEAVLPFYVLHHPVIVVIAFYTIPWDINMGIKFLFVSTAALLATLLLYDLLIRRWNGTRWLFGMKPLTPRKSEQEHEQTLDSTPSPPLKI